MKRTLAGTAIITAVATAGLFALYWSENPQARVAAVEKLLTEIPEVRLVYISDLEKQASQLITAYVAVDGKGEMGFTDLHPGSFKDSSHVYLHGIGPYTFRTRALLGGRETYGYAIDIGPDSPIPEARRLGIINVQAAVAQYDALMTFLQDWPVTTNEWPARTTKWSSSSAEEIRFADASGEGIFFSLKQSSLDISR